MSIFRKWHSFKIGPYKITIYGKRNRHIGIGYRLGCGHNITEICHSIHKNGIEIKKHTVKYEVDFAKR